MLKKLQKTDFLFVFAMLCGLLLHFFFIFIISIGDDESFYAVVPFRLINGDSLIRHEWNLTQFSSLFSFIPVYIWNAIKGSTEGLILFLRCVYLIIHTTIATTTYIFFRKYKGWAVVASVMFYLHAPYRFLAISYLSFFIIFLILLSFCLILIYQKKSITLYILTGVCYGICCICNPLFCIAFVFYLAIYVYRIIQEKKKSLESKIYDCFFTKDTIKYFTYGILIVAIIAVLFYFLTGGTISAIPRNLGNILSSSEYGIVSSSLFLKLVETFRYSVTSSFGTSLVLPIIFIALKFDKKKMTNKHRLMYLSVSLLWSIVYIFGVMQQQVDYACGASLPFFVISTLCYCLTEKKNKTLFYCMYLPCLIGTVFQYLAANTHLFVLGAVVTTNNVAGTFFAMDLFNEMRIDYKENFKVTERPKYTVVCRNIIITSICVQILFYGLFYQHNQISRQDIVKATSGPYAGLYMEENQYDVYTATIDDLDYIKSISYEDEPVLVVSFNNWMYLYLERPVATYTTWYQGKINTDALTSFYKSSTTKQPEFIYIDNLQSIDYNMEMFSEMFDFTRKDLSNGTLLIVERCKL